MESLRRKIKTAKSLQSVVKMMKVMAAVNIHQYEQAVISLADYTKTIEQGLHIVLKNNSIQQYIPERRNDQKNKKCGAIIFGSEQGMCGQFNEQITRYALAEIERENITSQGLSIFTVGSRIIPALTTAGYEVKQEFTMPSSLAGITPMVQEMLISIEAWQKEQNIERILLFYNRLHGNALSEPSKLQLLPLDHQWLQTIKQQTWQSHSLPIFTMEKDLLFASLLRQYFFISIYRAFVESLASENISRLTSMQTAQKNIEERIAEFTAQYRQARQTAITAELLEIVAAY